MKGNIALKTLRQLSQTEGSNPSPASNLTLWRGSLAVKHGDKTPHATGRYCNNAKMLPPSLMNLKFIEYIAAVHAICEPPLFLSL